MHALSQAVDETSDGSSVEQSILEQSAIVVLRSDELGEVGLGSSYLKTFTFFVPRSVWPEKPHLGEHVVALSSPQYPLADLGTVTTLYGDLYLNFRLLGVFLGGVVIGLLTGRLARWADGKQGGLPVVCCISWFW